MIRKRGVVCCLSLALLALSGCILLLPTEPEILYQEDFQSETNWYSGSNAYRTWSVQGGEYHLVIKASDLTRLSYNTTVGNLNDFRLDIDARQAMGANDNGYGVAFRMKDPENFYRFRISGDGWTRFDKKVNSQYVVIRDWERSSLINQGVASNHITIIANGSLFTFYVNGSEVYSVTDAQFSSGYAGVMGNSFTISGPMHIAFDNLVIRALE